MWVAIYFSIEDYKLEVANLSAAMELINEQAQHLYQESTCELILIPKKDQVS